MSFRVSRGILEATLVNCVASQQLSIAKVLPGRAVVERVSSEVVNEYHFRQLISC